MVHFWPDEWQRAIGGVRAVGLYLEFYSNDSNSWYLGKVIGYEKDTDKYKIQIDRNNTILNNNNNNNNNNQNDNNNQSSYSSNNNNNNNNNNNTLTEQVICVTIVLQNVLHHWLDMMSQQRLTNSLTPQQNNNNTNYSSSPILSELKYTNRDVGKFIRIWWQRYERYYYGRIIAFSSAEELHTIIYEDRDERQYDLKTKECEVITPPSNVFSQQKSNATDAIAAKIVADWHRSIASSTEKNSVYNKNNYESDYISNSLSDFNSSITDYNSNNSNNNNNRNNEYDSKNNNNSNSENKYIIRPSPMHSNNNISLYQFLIVKEFFKEGGIEAIFQSLVDTSQPPPVCKIISLHLQFIYQVRIYMVENRRDDLIWDLKEGIPFAFSRYEDTQIKEFLLKDFNDVFATMKDLQQNALSSSNDNATFNTNNNINRSYTTPGMRNAIIQEGLETMRLSIAAKLLVCSQLQRRYLGLSMIKDVIDSILPKMNIFILRRQQSLGLNQNKNYNNNNNAGLKKSNSNLQTQQNNTFKSTLNANKVNEWLVNSKIVEILFGESLHQDLIAKSDLILCYLAHRRLLTDKHIELLWSCSRGLHEAVVRVLHLLILVLVPFLEPSLRMHLFSLISLTPQKDYTEQTLQLIKSYTVQALSSFREEANKNNSNDNTSNNSNANNNNSSNNSNNNNNIDDFKANSSGNLIRKGMVVNAPQRQWMGFGVLW
jgi:hypothetical protein